MTKAANSIQDGLLSDGAAPAQPYPVCAMFGLLAFGFAYGELISNFGLIMLPAEANDMEPQANAVMMTLLLFVSGISQFSGPLAGYYSDRCQSSWGRRRPYLVAGTIFTVPALVCMWYAHTLFHTEGAHDGSMSMDGGSMAGGNATDNSSLFKGVMGRHAYGELLYMLAFLVAMAAFNVQNQTLGSLISDVVPQDQTGQANGIMAVLMLVGSLLGFLVFRTLNGGFGTTLDADGKPGAMHFMPFHIPVEDSIGKMYYYYIPVIIVTTLITIFGANEKKNPTTADRLPPVNCDDLAKCFFVSPTHQRDFFIVTMSRTAYYCGIATMAFLQYFFRDRVICSPPFEVGVCMPDENGNGRIQNYVVKTALIAVWAQAGSAVSAYPSGLLSDKFGRKPLVYAACLGMGAIYMAMPFFAKEETVMILGFCWGVFNGCFVAVDFALAIDTLPCKEEAAKFLGVWGVSAFVGTTIGPITGGLALYFFGQIEDPIGGGGGEMPEGTITSYRYSKYGYIGVMAFGAFWNVLSCVIINWVDFERASALEKRNTELRRDQASNLR